MGETTDGSSSAAQGAQDTEENKEKGLFERLFGAFGGEDEDAADGHDHHDELGNLQVPRGGMGNLRQMRVEDVALPRAEIVSVPQDIGLPELVEVFRESGLTRLPVYDGTLDTPVGLIHLKDLALRHGFNGKGGGNFDLKTMVRPLLFAPPSMPIGVLLQKMQSDRRHMALVIDEYGGVDGLVTIEDLIEQVIGEISDEHDIDEDKFWLLEKPGVYLAQSRTPLDEFEAETGLKLVDEDDEEEIDTLGGLVFVLTGRVPGRGEVIRHPAGAEFEIVDADARRIKRVRVRLNPHPAE
ncbi:transporter associated domain-containing protein [Rhodovulum sp. YNF3179]|uniref:transporter associated domain-containing protein n=1 Tax=Rhodovulum sp. YNF3179 TaxID=3425127 RepID=UPI003D32AABC